ncbi:cytochrome c biogenesis protein ResB [Nocardioides panacisoli]|uniref:cytochrome c biogenesis protein ResB n=1 Tax=Nocardioides panacisoli TaxID=627624 RepID=UPI001C63904F|nr:cytochrome c biogenesis protein ResB [Nocardioides panacisoli]QYJ03783.1 cytochrome c biogenesis protein ResB [Nocardioides panacisoli]
MSDAPVRRPGELTARELLRWTWRQLTSMRTALVLLLLLALAAVPGSVIPQEGVDSLAVTRWKDQHPDLTPIYERLDLFNVYDSVWFSAIYLLLVISLVGCIVPRTAVYWRALRAQPPAAPRNLSRMPDSTSYETDETPEAVLAHARAVLGPRSFGRGHRLRRVPTSSTEKADDAVSAERGRLREAGNLLFHLSVLVVLAGFAVGGLLGYQGGVILVKGSTFGNSLTQYDDFNPGGLFSPDQLDRFAFTVEDFHVDWLTEGPRAGMAQGFEADLSHYTDDTESRDEYTLRVNHPLTIENTDVFLIGHGYAPVITVRDGDGEVAYKGPTVFLPQDASFLSFGVVKAPAAEPQAIGLEGLFYPTFANVEGDPVTLMGDDLNPTISMLAYSGDIGLDDGSPESVYVLDKSNADQLRDAEGDPLRLDLQPGQTQQLPDGLGSVTFEGVEPWVRVQISQSPGKEVALIGVVLALIGLCGSLFIRPRRVFVRARAADGGGASTLVEVAVLDRSGNAEVDELLSDIVSALRGPRPETSAEEKDPS